MGSQVARFVALGNFEQFCKGPSAEQLGRVLGQAEAGADVQLGLKA